MSNIDAYVSQITDAVLRLGVSVTTEIIDEVIARLRMSPTSLEYQEIVTRVTANLTGYGELEPFISEDTTDILINSPTDVWKADSEGMRKINLNLLSELHVRRLASRLALTGQQRLDEALPYVDALLPDGARLHAIIPPLALHHTSLSLRFPTSNVIPIKQWIDDSKLDNHERDLLQKVIDGQASSVICGTTGAGKTALLRSVLNQRPATQRLIVIEDVSELNIDRPNTVQLQGRQPNTEGIGHVSAQMLVRQSLRMRPDAIVIGEIRGAEIVDFMLAISSGHMGSMSTIHAHDLITLQSRVALLAQVAGFSRPFALDLFRQSVDVVIQVEHRKAKRTIARIEGLNES